MPIYALRQTDEMHIQDLYVYNVYAS